MDKPMLEPIKLRYQATIVPKLTEQFGYANVHEVPKVIKVTINRGLGDASQNAKALESSINELTIITGQKPVVTRAKKAIAGFKLREGMPVGVMVTLRSERMYAFLDRLINLALPRIRDFRGISPNSFDGRGNYSLGIRERHDFRYVNSHPQCLCRSTSDYSGADHENDSQHCQRTQRRRLYRKL